MKIYDTIAAVSTPRGKGGVAMIRVSGTDAIPFAGKVFSPKNGHPLDAAKSNFALYGDISMPETDGKRVTIDDGIAIVYRAPRSFTGEDTVEICCHGGALVTESVLAACFAAGCRQAEAGEFTRRAFVNGKMGLSQAEGLGTLLEAQTYEQLLLSRGSMKGVLSDSVRGIYEQIRTVLSSIYAKIDFPDEDLSSLSPDQMFETSENICAKLEKLADTYHTGRAITEGIKTVICGRTNAGKSSLYNRLVGRDAAIVTSREGTTRDVLSETVALGGVTLRLCDTAGLRKTDDEIENIGIERANKALDDAELVLAVFDATRSLDNGEDAEFIKRLEVHSGTVIVVLNKCDSGTVAATAENLRASFENTVEVSALTGKGCDGLAKMIADKYIDGSIDLSGDAVVVNARQYGSVMRALGSLQSSLDAMRSGTALDLCCIGLEEAMSVLGEIDGREVTEDIVAQIFTHFCVGK